MSTFGAYASYYDLLNRDKDYAGEARYVESLIRQHAAAARSVLDLGCGTGVHLSLLAERGFEGEGVDRSAEMIAQARQRAAASPASLRFHVGTIGGLRLGRRFDVVTALFHVMSYQTADVDLAAAFATAAAHLEPGGLFVFDYWYGPAVLHQRPERRERVFEDDRTQIRRFAVPEHDEGRHVVTVAYDFVARDRLSGATDRFSERHPMRYLFDAEIGALLEGAGLTALATGEWMTDAAPGEDTWSVVTVARK